MKTQSGLQPTSPPVSPVLVLFLLFGVAVASGFAFAPGLRGEFLNWDDDRNFIDNPSYKGAWPDVVRWAWSTYHLGVWQPAAWLLFAFQYRTWGDNPVGYHAVSLTFHILNTWLVYALLVRLLSRQELKPEVSSTARYLASAAAAGLFAVHPLRCEPVCWISCQPYLPATLFCILGMFIYVGPGKRPQRDVLVLVCYLLAISFKAVAITLPFLLLAFGFFLLERRREWARALVEKIPMFVVAGFVAAWAIAAKDHSESRMPFREFEPGVRFAQAAAGIWFYLLKTIWPSDLAAYYRLPAGLGLSNWRYAAATVMAAAVTLVLFVTRRRQSAGWLYWCWYLVVLLPNIGLIQISQQLAADRYSYLASVPIAFFVARTLVPLMRGNLRPAGIGLVLLATLLLLLKTRDHSRTWKDSESLWNATLSIDPECGVAHCNLGESLARKGNYADASRHLSRAIDLEPDLAFAYTNLGAIFCKARRFEDAAALGERALGITPALHGKDLARTHAMLGEAYAGLRRDDLAWKHTRIAEKLGLKETEKMLDYLRTISREPQ